MIEEKELWNYFWNKKIAISKPFDRHFIWVSRECFERVRHRFRLEYNLFHPGKSYRSSGYITHIHAIDQQKYFFVHKDIGNWTKFFPLGILHLALDVFPYIIFSLWRGVPPGSLFNYLKSLASLSITPSKKRMKQS